LITLINAALSRPRTVLLSLLLILIAGTITYREIPKESNPDITVPIMYVTVTHEGISPEDAERLLIRPLEQELQGIEGLKEMRATGFEGGGNIVLEFEAGFDSDAALADVRNKVDVAKTELPEESDEPSVNEVNLSLFPVVTVNLSGPVPERTLVRLANDLQDDLEGLPSVLSVDIVGDREEQVEIVIDPLLVESYGLSAGDLVDVVNRSNRLVAAGALDTGEGRFAIKVPGLFENLGDILDMPVKVSGDAVVRLRDIASVRRNFKDPQSFARLDGEPAVALEVSKRPGENIIDTIAAVRQAVTLRQASWPDTIQVTYTGDESENIRNMLTDLQNNVLMAVLLVMVVIVAALGIKSSALVGVAIPGSFLAGMLVLATMGLTVNIVVLFSLILAVGMLVDGAIVVTEFADRRLAEGASRFEAYGAAARRMAWPITASTATTLAAFLPLVFWPGVVGEFMKYLPITLLATLTASLLMALVFVPTLGSVLGRRQARKADAQDDPGTGDEGDLSDLRGGTRLYAAALNRVLRRPGLVVLAALGVLIGVQWYYANHGNGIEFFPDVEPERAALNVHARGNLSVFEKAALVQEVESRILDVSGIKSVYTRAGEPVGMREDAEDVIGTIQLEFVDWQKRRKASVILDEVRERTADLAGIVVEPRQEEAGPTSGKPVQIELNAIDNDVLPVAAATVREHMEEMDGLINIEDGLPMPGIEWQLDVDRAQAAKFGADVTLIGNAVQMVTNGIKFGEYRPDNADDELDIRARFPEQHRTLDQLDRIRVQTNAGLVPISNFVERKPSPRVGRVNRTDSHRVVTLKADVAEGVLPDTQVKALQAWLATGPLDAGVHVNFKGEDEEQKEAQSFLVKAFGVALFIMAIILVTQFNSFYSAFLILSAVIMSTVGVMIGLLVTGQPFGIVMSGIGVIALAGIVVNNNIVLIDTYDHLKKTAASPREAILRTGIQRLRPVMLTTITTVLGLMPMVLGINIDFVTREVTVGAPSTQWWTQLATAIVAGLTFATVLTLLVTPSALMLKANASNWRRRRRARKHPEATEEAPVYSRAAE
tara:strand:+ start:563 stop:3736 length:3174 start_codon:yes stop_codon:yes gene_type:complete